MSRLATAYRSIGAMHQPDCKVQSLIPADHDGDAGRGLSIVRATGNAEPVPLPPDPVPSGTRPVRR